MKNKENINLDFVAKHYKPNRLDTEKAIKKFHKERGIVTPLRTIALRVSAVAASVVIGAILLSRIVFMPQSEWVNIVAANENISVFLPDSTEVTLMVGSEISYDAKAYAKEIRHVSMSGEVYFDVRRNESLPFEVWAKVVKVEVLGTQFSVAESEASTEVYVESGRVRFSSMDDASSAILTKGMAAQLTGDNVITLVEANTINPLAWATGLFAYSASPLSSILDELSDYYGVELTCSTPNKELTATFTTDSLDEIIMLIESVLDVKIVKL